jgi:dTMP kinase
MPRGLFVTLEGPEGSGKTTQAMLLAGALSETGRVVKLCHEPGGGPISRAIREILLNPAFVNMVNRTELLLFLAARAQHVEETIRPALETGEIVICDRFSDSTIAYQGHAEGLDEEIVTEINFFATNGLVPDLTILLDIDALQGLSRQPDWNRMEAKGLEYHERVRQGFLIQARLHPKRIRVLDASRPIEALHADILQLVTTCLGEERD